MTAATDPSLHALERSRRLLLPEFVARNARRRPDKTALVFGDATVSFAQLEERTSRLANALADRGVGQGDRVALLLFNGLEVVEAFFGCHKAGATPVPVNFRLVQDEIDYILENSGAVGVVADEGLAARAAAAARTVPGVRFHLAVGEAPEGAERYEDALAAASPDDPAVDLGDDDLAA